MRKFNVQHMLTSMLLCLVAGCLMVSCASKSAGLDVPPRKLGRIGAKIDSQPGNADRILKRNGLTREEFEEAIRKLANDPELSKEYEEGFSSQKSS